MHNAKLHDYLSSLSVYELNRFRKYIHSPYYNEDERIKRFVEVILPYAKAATLHRVNEKDIWKAAVSSPGKRKGAGGEVFNRAKFIRLLSDTVKKLEHFLVTDRFQQNKQLQHISLLEIMNERKLLKHFAEFLSLTEKRQQQQPCRDGHYYYHELLIQEQKNFYIENREQRSTEKNLEQVLHSADVYYLLTKLKYSAALLHYRNFLSVEAEVSLWEELLQLAAQKKFDIPAIQIYRRIVLSLTEPENETHYRTLKELITANRLLFKQDELKTMFVFAMNYCIQQINKGNGNYLKELLSLYKFALQNDLLLENGQLSQWDYKNIVTVGLRVNEYKWVEQFMEDYKPALAKADRTNAYTFNRARYFFYTKNYDRVLRLLQDVKYNDIFYQLDSKTTLLKTYYELGEELPLLSLKDSFRILLKRKRLITPQQQQNYMNLLRFTFRLFKADVKNKKQMKALQKEIELTQNIADKSWLLEKLNELL